ncbi:MAG: CRTAC1 family protein [Acidobacteria bacterium]|nr:CRTAC1 family protein [Acidobacteriota bacterium]
MKLVWFTLSLVLVGCSGDKPVPQSSASKISFRDVAADVGLDFTHVNGASGKFYMPEIMGAGAALIDYDNDGDLDVFFVQGGSVEDPSSGPGNRFFRNELIPGGQLRFTDITRTAGLDHRGYGMGAATGDFDNDGHMDLLVTNYGANVLYRNRGNGAFEDVTAQSPAIRKADTWSSSASFFDYDRDGWQDLVILTYVDFTLKNHQQCKTAAGEADYCTPVVYRPVPARLFHNEKGRFVDVTTRAGLDRAKGPGLGVQAIDANQDGWLDLFVANDTAANHLWINQKNGTFLEKALELGTAFAEDGLPRAGMGVAAGDYNQDGRDDLLVLNLMREGATLFRSEAAGYRDVSMATRIHALTFAYTGFGAGWLDVDNDGWLDLFLAHGAVTQREEQRGQSAPFKERNLLLRNNAGAGFSDISDQAGETMQLAEITRGAAFGDVNNDGRVDVLITNNGGRARLLLNESAGAAGLSIAFPGVGFGLGVRVGLEREDAVPTLWRRVHTDGSYASASSPVVYFGAGGMKAKRFVIEWPDGSRTEQPAALGRTVVRSVHKR